jgi:hypothetical protein
MAEIVAPARPPDLILAIAALALAMLAAPAALARPRVSVQPIEGIGGSAVRATVVRVVRRKGMRVTTGIPRAEGTGQYYTWAREVGVKAFVAGELETRGKRQRATFLVWSGSSGSVVGRWTVVGRTGKLALPVARGFWRHLGRAVARAQPPKEWRELPPGPTMRINAGSAFDGDIVGSLPAHAGRRPRR